MRPESSRLERIAAAATHADQASSLRDSASERKLRMSTSSVPCDWYWPVFMCVHEPAGANPIAIRLVLGDVERPVGQELLRASYELIDPNARPIVAAPIGKNLPEADVAPYWSREEPRSHPRLGSALAVGHSSSAIDDAARLAAPGSGGR